MTLKTWYTLTLSLTKQKGIDGYRLNQTLLLQSKEDRETAHKLLDAMIDEMGVPK